MFTGDDILAEIDAAPDDVAVVTLAPELPGGLDLVARLVAGGHRVSLGHSAATYDQALEAIAAGARHATHLFNRMPPLAHREPGLAGAVLASEEVAAEVICDGYHVHRAMVRTAVAVKHASRVMAITDGTAGSGMPPGTRVRLGGRTITATEHSAFLEDGTIAGSVLTMDRAFRVLVEKVGLGVVDAALLCATTPARELKIADTGSIALGQRADLRAAVPRQPADRRSRGGRALLAQKLLQDPLDQLFRFEYTVTVLVRPDRQAASAAAGWRCPVRRRRNDLGAR